MALPIWVEFISGTSLPQHPMSMYSVGMDLNVRFEKLLATTGTLRIGVRAAYNGGEGYDYFAGITGMDNPFYIGPVLNMEF